MGQIMILGGNWVINQRFSMALALCTLPSALELHPLLEDQADHPDQLLRALPAIAERYYFIFDDSIH